MLPEDVSREVAVAHKTNTLWRLQSSERIVSPRLKSDLVKGKD